MNSDSSTIALFTGSGLALSVALFAHVVGYDRDRAFYPVVLTVVGSLYVLFAVMAGGSGLIPEIAFFALFASAAVAGFQISLWIAAIGLALHGVFDFFRHAYFPAPGAPDWWPAFCGSYDVVAAAGLAVLLKMASSKGGGRLRPD